MTCSQLNYLDWFFFSFLIIFNSKMIIKRKHLFLSKCSRIYLLPSHLTLGRWQTCSVKHCWLFISIRNALYKYRPFIIQTFLMGESGRQPGQLTSPSPSHRDVHIYTCCQFWQWTMNPNTVLHYSELLVKTKDLEPHGPLHTHIHTYRESINCIHQDRQ